MKLNLGGSVYNPTDPVGRLLFNVLAMVAEFADLVAKNIRDGLAAAAGAANCLGPRPPIALDQRPAHATK